MSGHDEPERGRKLAGWLPEVEVVVLTAEQETAAFEATCRREMGISAEEFLRRWQAGEWAGQDLDGTPGLVEVWIAMPSHEWDGQAPREIVIGQDSTRGRRVGDA